LSYEGTTTSLNIVYVCKMPSAKPRTTTDIASDDMTAEQLALPSSRARYAKTQYGVVQGGTVRNGTAVFLSEWPFRSTQHDTHCRPRLWSQTCRTHKPWLGGTTPSHWTRGLATRRSHIPKTGFTVPSAVVTTFHVRRRLMHSGRMLIPEPKRMTLGLGSPTESPFFADIYVPSTVALDTPDTSPHTLKPVRVFIHGGFLQFGSTSGFNYNQQFFPAEEFDEVRVLLAYRVSVLGFLSSEKHKLEGNYGFKDCWAGLEWVRKNIAAFGGESSEMYDSRK
jgi:hypothetical protein